MAMTPEKTIKEPLSSTCTRSLRMAYRWYYQLLNEEFGPVSEAEIHDLVHIGALADDDLVRREDSVKWCPFAEMHLAAVATASDGGPSELGDLSELSFSFGDSSALPEIADESNLLRMDEIQFEDESSRSAPRRRSRAIESPGAERDTEGWYYESLGNELGPMPLERLIGMADRGIITGADRVRNSANGIWIPFANVSALAAAWLNGNRDSSGPASSGAAASSVQAERPTAVTSRAASPAPRPHVVTRTRCGRSGVPPQRQTCRQQAKSAIEEAGGHDE